MVGFVGVEFFYLKTKVFIHLTVGFVGVKLFCLKA